MEKDEIALLLEKYWKAETTIEEEKVIKSYLAAYQGNAGEENTAWFMAIEEAKYVQPNTAVKLKSKKKSRFAIMNIAASLLIVAAAVAWGLNHHSRVQAKQAAALQKQVEADLSFIAEALDQGHRNMQESADVLLNVNN